MESKPPYTEWVGRRPRLQLPGSELSRAGRRAVVAGPAGGIPEQRYEGSAMYYSAGAAAGLNTLIVTHGVSDRRSPRRSGLVVLDELAQVVFSDPVLVPDLHGPQSFLVDHSPDGPDVQFQHLRNFFCRVKFWGGHCPSMRSTVIPLRRTASRILFSNSSGWPKSP